MESDASHLRNLIERVREYDQTLMKYFGTSIIVEAGNERFEMNKAADEAEAFLNKET